MFYLLRFITNERGIIIKKLKTPNKKHEIKYFFRIYWEISMHFLYNIIDI